MAESEFTRAADAHWDAFMGAAGGACLSPEAIDLMGHGAALLMRVAKASPSPDARAAERWLAGMLRTASFAKIAAGEVR